MNRKNFINTALLSTIGMFFPPKTPGMRKVIMNNMNENDWLETKHLYDDYNVKIISEGIKENIKVLHISDTHLSILKANDSEFPEYTSRMDSAYQKPEHYLTGISDTKQNHFANILLKARQDKADLLVLTGDIINNPTKANVEYVKEKLDSCGIDYLYTPGNHDWHFEGMAGEHCMLHTKWVSERLGILTKGASPFYHSKIVKGINFVMIDNSTYQVTKEQVDFFVEQTQKAYPVVLCMHIPVYQSSDLKSDSVSTMGDPRWGAEYDDNFEVEKRERWPESGNDKTTYEFVMQILSCRNLLAVLAGHDHSAKQSRLNPSAFQYLTKASYSGAYINFEFQSP